MTKMNLCDLVLDFSLYPRVSVDSTHVRRLHEAFLSGVTLPFVIVDEKSKRVVDGFHRVTMWKQELSADAEVGVEVRSYKTEADLSRRSTARGSRLG